MKFSQLLKEYSEELSVEEMQNEIETISLNNFPKCGIRTHYSTNLGKSIDITFTLGKNKQEYENGIELNDPLRHIIIIMFRNNGNFDLEFVSGDMSVKSESPYKAYGSIKTKLRNKSNITFSEVKSILDKFFKNLKKIIKDNKDKIHPNNIELFKSKNLI